MATPQSVRYINARRALDSLFRSGPCSRAELSRSLGMTRSATGSIIADLLDAGLVAEIDSPALPGPRRMGRPGIEVAIDPAGARFVGAEIGVDRLSVVVLDLAAQPVSHCIIAHDTPAHAPEATIDALVGLIRSELAGAAGRADGGAAPEAGPLRGICVCLPALMSPGGDVINGLLVNWRDVPLRRLLVDRLGEDVPVAIENDANAFAIAETYGRSGERDKTHAFLLIEVGVGGGIVIGGELFRGGNGLAGEFGQTLLGGRGWDAAGRPRPGHVESYVGRDALLAHWRDLGGGGGGAGGLPDFLSALSREEEEARAAAADWGARLGQGLVQVTAILNPSSIILGGSVAPVFAHVADRVAACLTEELLAGYPPPPILLSRLGMEGPALGAACLMHQTLFRIENDAAFGLTVDEPAA